MLGRKVVLCEVVLCEVVLCEVEVCEVEVEQVLFAEFHGRSVSRLLQVNVQIFGVWKVVCFGK